MTAGRSLLVLLVLSLSTGSSGESRLRKCCPAGEIFSGRSKVDCVPAPRNATELYSFDYDDAARYDGLPRCNEPEDVSTTPLDELGYDDFLQVPACLEILHEQSTQKSYPIVVHCRSYKDRNESNETSSAFLPGLLDVKRCCPRGNFFDRQTKTCVPSPQIFQDANYSDVEDFVSLLPSDIDTRNFLKIQRGPFKCHGPIFDYEIDAEDIVFEDGLPKVILPSKNEEKERILVAQNNGCLELTEESTSNRKLVVRVCRGSEYCQKNVCVRKCCAEDEFYFFTRGCDKFVDSVPPLNFHETLQNVTNQLHAADYGLLVGTPCKHDMYPVIPEDEWSLTAEGYLHVPDYDTYEHHRYCMDILYNSTDYKEDLYPLVCFEDPEKQRESTEARYKFNSALEVTSCTFLLLTLLVYACLPVLQNLHGKTLMCHVSSLLLAYTCLAAVPWLTPNTFYWASAEEPEATIICSTLGYTMLFSLLSAFFWLNVMCFDIWWTFGGLRGTTSKGRGHRKRFLLYCAYAWGLPLCLTILGIVGDQVDLLPSYLRPNIGLASCWFTQLPEFYGELVFFVGPVTIQLVSNVVFFVLTSVHCSKVKTEIRRVIADPSHPRSKRFHADRTKLVMNMKLFIVMGISWVMEMVSFFVNKYGSDLKWQQELFYATDAFNCLQGLLIFILFVLKTRVYVALKRRLGINEKKKVASQATTALQDPYRVKKSASSSTLMSTFAVSMAP